MKLFSVASLLIWSSAQATTFTVSTIDDAGPGSLRQAIQSANAAPSPPHRIEFSAGFLQDGMIELFSPLPLVQVELEIDGSERSPFITVFDPGNSFQLLRSSKALTLRRLSFSQGRGSGQGGCVSGEGTGVDHVLSLDRVAFTGCSTVTAGAASATGGAVSWPNGAQVEIRGSRFDGNGAAALGTGAALGGALHVSGSLRVESSIFTGNLLNGGFVAGGAIAGSISMPANVEIRNSVFTGNIAQPDPVASPGGIGGAVSLDCSGACSVRIEGTFFGANRSLNAGAAFVRSNGGVASIALGNSSFAGNHAVGQGGALFANSAHLEVRHVTFFDNGAAAGGHVYTTLSSIGELSNSVLAPVAAGSGGACSIGTVATISVGNYRSASEFTCTVSVPGATPVQEFRVDGISSADTVPVVVFDRSSPVVDGGDAGRCLPSDALGAVRPQDGNGDGIAACDAGALEHLPADGIFTDDFGG